MNGCVVAGIGTDVGKTVASAVLVEAFDADYWKPVQTGSLDDADTAAVQSLVSATDRTFHPVGYHFLMPASPHAAAAAEGAEIDVSSLTLPETDRFLLVELAGGLMVPLNEKVLNIDLLEGWGLPVVLVSNYYLGSINHTLLSIEALKQRNIPIAGLVLNGDVVPESRSIILSYGGERVLLDLPQTDQVTPDFIQTYAKEVVDVRA